MDVNTMQGFFWNDVMVAASMVFVFVSALLFAWGLLPDISSRLIRKRILTELAEERLPTMLDQLVDVLAPLNQWLPTGWYSSRTIGRLQAGGVRMSFMHMLVMQEIGALTGLVIYAVTVGLEKINVVWLMVLVLMGWFVPDFWLANRIHKRRMSISRDLPEVVDLLNLCIDAGLDFMSSLGRVVREFRQCPTTEELGLVVQEVRVGKRRRDALHAFAQRVQTTEARSFARTLRQADRMGTGLAEALVILSEDMRQAQYHWAERFAQQAPLKMLVPLLFSLAAALIIVAGPIMIQFLQGGAFSAIAPGGPQ
jgi:tight adherence protein C